MIFKEFQNEKLSMLGFGTMRLPTNPDRSINEPLVEQMIATAMAQGLNYFDTAYPYHDGKSEIVIAKALSAYPRESYNLATKYPGHQISSHYDPAAIFEEQLKKCNVEYFDFYLLHNVFENSMPTYLDARWGILEYFREQKRLGRIRHLGMSTHGRLPMLEEFLDIAGDDIEFCQIQLNWVDWTLQEAKEKVDILNRRGIPVWVMEPVRGGKLCDLGEEKNAKLKALRPEESIAAWGFRFLQDIPGVTMILSGMSNMAQMEDNLRTFAQPKPLSGEERQLLLDMAEEMKDSIPCTTCRYCVKECPMGLDIPGIIFAYNEMRYGATPNVFMRIEGWPEEKRPSACLACGKCAKMCPQNIDIPAVMKETAARFAAAPSWALQSRQREEAAKKLREGK